MSSGKITILLNQVETSDQFDLNKIFSLLYQEIKQVAVFQLSKIYNNDTLSPTVLAHECYIKLIKQEGIKHQDRKHFLNYLSIAMRRYIIDQIRSKNRAKRSAQLDFNQLSQIIGDKNVSIDIIQIDKHIDTLTEVDHQLAQLFQQKLLFDFTFKELAQMHNLSERHVIRKWNHAKSLILTLLESSDEY